MSRRVFLAAWLTILPATTSLLAQTPAAPVTNSRPALAAPERPPAEVADGRDQTDTDRSAAPEYSSRRTPAPSEQLARREAAWAKQRKAVIAFRKREGISLLRPNVIDQRRFGTPRRFFYGPVWKTLPTTESQSK